MKQVSRCPPLRYGAELSSLAISASTISMVSRCQVALDELVTQNLCQSTVKERLAKYVKYKASLFYFYFSPDSPTEVTRGWVLTHNGSKYALWRKEVPSWGPYDGRQHFGVQIPQEPSKIAFYRHARAVTNGFKTNDVLENWRYWLRSVARSPLLAVPRILFIASRE